MRLTAKEAGAIRIAAVEAFGPGAVVRLFGSRLDDSRRGGDIDLLVTPPGPVAMAAVGSFRLLLERHVGERAYDIIVSSLAEPVPAVERKALAEGIVL